MARFLRIDKPLSILIGVLVASGVMVFLSAAFGLLARGRDHMSSVVFNHLALGVGLGLVGLVVALSIDYRIWRRFAIYLFAASLLLTAAVFIPQVGTEHGGGTRWIIVFGTSFQPSEALKLGTILFAAAYFAAIRSKVSSTVYGLGGIIGILALPALVLLLQPDLGTLGVITISVLAIYFAAGASWRDIALVSCICIIGLGTLAIMRPYVRDRIVTFIYPSLEQQGQGYQIRQSLIAIGSGGITGRGFGQGVQKFTYLPEPMGDSIFAVAGEELGFVGASGIVLLFLGLALRGYIMAARAPDTFGAFLAVGISTYLASEALINIAAMLGLAPLTGIPLTFISQGGSAMLVSLASAGILLSVSRRSPRTRSL
jgi:cell division protein FtsW